MNRKEEFGHSIPIYIDSNIVRHPRKEANVLPPTLLHTSHREHHTELYSAPVSSWKNLPELTLYEEEVPMRTASPSFEDFLPSIDTHPSSLENIPVAQSSGNVSPNIIEYLIWMDSKGSYFDPCASILGISTDMSLPTLAYETNRTGYAVPSQERTDRFTRTTTTSDRIDTTSTAPNNNGDNATSFTTGTNHITELIKQLPPLSTLTPLSRKQRQQHATKLPKAVLYVYVEKKAKQETVAHNCDGGKYQPGPKELL